MSPLRRRLRAVLARAPLLLLCLACSARALHAQEGELLERAVSVRPSARQLAWQEREFLAFVHFGPNTFSGREWGTGREEARLFQPTALDAGQWVRVAQSAGMRGFVLTAKHHDGFCLWPSAYTSHDVSSSGWQDGDGDVVGALAQACARADLAFGFYLSPADLHEIERTGGYYGNGSTPRPSRIPSHLPAADAPQFSFVVDDYNRYFLNQLYELLTRYGPVTEVWFDGANPKPGTGQTYAYEAWYTLIRALAPEAVIAIKGPDVRWCGNEAGNTRAAEWSVIPLDAPPAEATWPDMTARDLGSLERLRALSSAAGKPYLHWYPAETNTSLRHGWFWRDEAQTVKSADEILDVWYRSVGGNSVFLLNLTPDERGLIPDRDAAVLAAVGATLRDTFATNLAADATATADVAGDTAHFALDGDQRTAWRTPDGTTSASLTVRLPAARPVNRAVLMEPIAVTGQRIAALDLEVWTDAGWRRVASATTVGYKRILRFPTLRTEALRLIVRDARVSVAVSHFSLHLESVRLTTPVFARDRQGSVSMRCDPPGPTIRFTLDGTDPTPTSSAYVAPIPLRQGGSVRARAFDESGRSGPLAVQHFDVTKSLWSVLAVDSEETGHGEAALHAIDEDPATIWHTAWDGVAPAHPHWIEIDFGEELELEGFTYLPRQDLLNGSVRAFELYLRRGPDEPWGEPVLSSSFANVQNDRTERVLSFAQVTRARQLRFVALDAVDGKPWTSAAELGVVTR